MKEMSLIMALKDFFGLKDGQSLGDFIAETKKLTDLDKADLKVGLISAGYSIKD
jgi:hypothetical protein